jgi:broad specificity phosphatase PhoE
MRRQKAEGKRQKAGRSHPVDWALALVLLLLLPATAAAQQMVIVVRHAERADGGASAATMTTPATDPLLSAAGEARAAKLAALLADAGVKAILASEYRRTQDTGKPLAAKLGLTVQAVPARDAAALVAKIKGEHAKDVVLVIGHSNTVPAVIKALGGPAVMMREDEYDALYILSPATGALTLIRY